MAPEDTSFQIKFIPTGTSQTPVAVNCSGVNVAQGTGYIDFGFIEPRDIVALTDALRAGEKAPEEVEAKHLLRLTMSPEAMVQLVRQLNDVLTKVGVLKPAEPK